MKKIVISLGIIVLFSMAIITIISFAQFDNSYKINPNNLVDMTSEQIIYYIQEKQLNQTPIFSYLFPFFSFAGILIGLLVFYIMSLVLVLRGVNDFITAYLHTLRYQRIFFYRTMQKSVLNATFIVVFVKLFGFAGLGIEYILTNVYLILQLAETFSRKTRYRDLMPVARYLIL